MNDQEIKNESQRYLDEMMRFYSMNKNASVSTATPSVAVRQSGEQVRSNDTNVQTNSSAADNGEFENGMRQDIADEEKNEPSVENGEFDNDTRQQSDIEYERKNESSVQNGRFRSNMRQQSDIADQTANEPKISPQTEPVKSMPEDSVSFESRFPVPIIPDFIQNPEPPVRDEKMYTRPDYGKMSDIAPQNEQNASFTDQGFLKVEVRTGENGIPVPNASVVVTKKNGVKDDVVFTGATDESGSVPRITLPAPYNRKGDTPGSFQNYAMYTVSAYYKDFYREVSSDVPVFAGVTSIQRFNLIPMPFNYDDNGQSVNHQNTVPNI